MNDVIPESLDEAVELLRSLYDRESIEEIRSTPEDEFVTSVHRTMGMYIRNTWQLWWYMNHMYRDDWKEEKPKLVEFFNNMGIAHADDMSSIVIRCFHRFLKGKYYDLDAQVESYKNYWKENGYPEDGIPKK